MFQRKSLWQMYLLVATDKPVSIRIKDNIITSSQKENLFIKLDSTLSFENHLTNLWKKASQKLHALARVFCFMDLD